MGYDAENEGSKGKAGKDFSKSGKGDKCKGWEKAAALGPEAKREWLRVRMKRVLNNALRGWGSTEVADALIYCVNDAIDGARSEEESEGGENDTDDSIPALFR